MSGIRVVLTITPANPELFAALETIPARLRAERIRTLATIGLAAVSGAVGGRAVNGPAADPSSQNQGGADRAMTFARSLGTDI
ncbi:MAG: hypothetical protein WC383_10150 [Gammaproteobacteria bacterium]